MQRVSAETQVSLQREFLYLSLSPSIFNLSQRELKIFINLEREKKKGDKFLFSSNSQRNFVNAAITRTPARALIVFPMIMRLKISVSRRRGTSEKLIRRALKRSIITIIIVQNYSNKNTFLHDECKTYRSRVKRNRKITGKNRSILLDDISISPSSESSE